MDPNLIQGALSPQDIFNLNLDTKTRMDRVFNTPNDINSYSNRDVDPLDKTTQINIFDAAFSDDPTIKAEATKIISSTLYNNTPELKYKKGFALHTPYEQGSKYIDRAWGFDPTRDNEDLYYNLGYAQKTGVGKILDTAFKTTARLAGGIFTKTGETLGNLTAMIVNAIPEAWSHIEGTDFNWIQAVAENSVSKAFEEMEDTMKERLLPVFKPAGWDERGIFEKLGNGVFWSDEIADGLSFMGSMIATSYLLGPLTAPLRGVTIPGASKLARFGRGTMQTITGAKDTEGVIIWANSVISESMMESSEKFKDVKKRLLQERDDGKNNFSDKEINQISGDAGAESLKGNLLTLGISNAFENRFIFQPLLKKIRGTSVRGSLEANAPGASKAIGVREGTTTENFAQAFSKRPTYKGLLDKVFNFRKKLSDPFGSLRFYGGIGARSFIIEGLWEENTQLAIERLSEMTDYQSLNRRQKTQAWLSKSWDQMNDTFAGKDREAETSIGLGAIIGLIGGGGTSAAMRERRKGISDHLDSIKKYEEERKSYLSTFGIYERNADGTIVKENGEAVVDKKKAEAMLDGINAHYKTQITIDQLTDPITRRDLQSKLMTRFMFAAKRAGIFHLVNKHFENIGQKTNEEVLAMGFDPTTPEDIPQILDMFKKQSKRYDEVFESRIDVSKPKKVKQKDFDHENQSRKLALFSTLNEIDSHTWIADHYSALGYKNLNNEYSKIGVPATFETAIIAYNSVAHQLEILEEHEKSEDNAFFSSFYKLEKERLKKEKEDLEFTMISFNDKPIVIEAKDEELEKKLKKERGEGKNNFTDEEIDAQVTTGDKVYISKNKVKPYLRETPTGYEPNSEESSKIISEMGNNTYGDFIKQAKVQFLINKKRHLSEQISDKQNGFENWKKYQETVPDALIEKMMEELSKHINTGKNPDIKDEQRKKATAKHYPKQTDNVTRGVKGSFIYRHKADNRIAEDLYFFHDMKKDSVKNLKDFIAEILNNSLVDPYLKTTLRQLLQYVPDTATITFDTTITRPAFYKIGTNNITVDPEMINGGQISFEAVVLHELIHLLTSDELVKNGEFTKIITDLFDDTKAQLEAKGIDTAYYGFTNIHEFLSEAFTNPEFQKELIGLPSKDGRTSIWTEFISAIVEFFKRAFNMDISPSALNDIFLKVEDFLEKRNPEQQEDEIQNLITQLIEMGVEKSQLSGMSKNDILILATEKGLIHKKAENVNEKLTELKVRLENWAVFLATKKEAETPEELVLLNTGGNALQQILTRQDWFEMLAKIYDGISDILSPVIRDLFTEVLHDLSKKREEATPEQIKAFVERLTKGEKMTTPEDIQFYDNNKKAIDQQLVNKKLEQDENTNILEAKKADIERRRQEELSSHDGEGLKGEEFDKINAKYDAELASLEEKPIILYANFEKISSALNNIASSAVIEEVEKNLRQVFELAAKAEEAGMTYEQYLRANDIKLQETTLAKTIDDGKTDGTVTVVSQNPSEIENSGKATTLANATNANITKFIFLQKLSDNPVKKDQYKLILSIEISGAGKRLVKARVADGNGNPLRFDSNANEVEAGGSEIIFDIDLISHSANSLNKRRVEASGKTIDPAEKARNPFVLHKSYMQNGEEITDVDEVIKDLIQNSNEKVLANIDGVLQGMLLRPGVTNKMTFKYDPKESRTTLLDLIEKNQTRDAGIIVEKTEKISNVFRKSGTLNVQLARDFNDKSMGFEMVEFIPNTLDNLQYEVEEMVKLSVQKSKKSFTDFIRPIIQEALLGKGNKLYMDLLEKLLDKRIFMVLDLGGSFLLTNRAKFTNLINSKHAKDAKVLQEKIVSLVSIDEIMTSTVNIDKELYQNEDSVVDIIGSYQKFIQMNVTTGANAVKWGGNREGFLRLNKRIVVTLDKSFGELNGKASDISKAASENSVKVGNIDTTIPEQGSEDGLKETNCQI